MDRRVMGILDGVDEAASIEAWLQSWVAFETDALLVGIGSGGPSEAGVAQFQLPRCLVGVEHLQWIVLLAVSA